MKTFKNTRILITIFGLFTLVTACNNDGSDESIDDLENAVIGNEDKEALLFMLEEEKLARDTYRFLDDLWAINQFSNIKESEQSHMNAVIALLDQFAIGHTILPDGDFANGEIQELYDQFIIDGSIDEKMALRVGATIEDLDIVDLEDYLNSTMNDATTTVFESLQCGSRNHLKSFVSALELYETTYEPQYLSEADYELIISSSKEHCGR
ncbi:DUF2202 domain-containing protein [Maribacter halichondriae]|uniref:DUF2202 domain-containing protein n=1 Tax=Maribacter halichondriae TaxID=2980554 RepID=UPI002358A020|nr:DUF2202 domain-containing protein [Maribacter sp. Hal144]